MNIVKQAFYDTQLCVISLIDKRTPYKDENIVVLASIRTTSSKKIIYIRNQWYSCESPH